MASSWQPELSQTANVSGFALSNVILNYFLIRKLGINGAALALTLTQIITNFISVCYNDTQTSSSLITFILQ